MVLGVPSRAEAFRGQALPSPVCNDCEFFGLDLMRMCVSFQWFLSWWWLLVILLGVAECCLSEQGGKSDVHFSVHSDQCLKELPNMAAGSWQRVERVENQRQLLWRWCVEQN